MARVVCPRRKTDIESGVHWEGFMAIRVLLVGRHEGLLEGLRAQLSCDDGFVVHVHAVGIAQAETCLRKNELDVIVVDGDFPLESVLAFAKLARSLRPACRLLLIESTQIGPWQNADPAGLFAGLIGRQDLPHCLPEAVRAIGAARTYLSPEVCARAVTTEHGIRYLAPQAAPPDGVPASGDSAQADVSISPRATSEPGIAVRNSTTRPQPDRGNEDPKRPRGGGGGHAHKSGDAIADGRHRMRRSIGAGESEFHARAARRAEAFRTSAHGTDQPPCVF